LGEGLTAALYIHIPFCARKCGYCDFYSRPLNTSSALEMSSAEALLDRFAERLCADIEGQIERFGAAGINSVYAGGGTPSLLGPRRMKALLDFLRSRLPGFAGKRRPAPEFTVEVNPESLSEDFLRVCAEGGVTRISCGVQTFSPASREAIGRSGKPSRLYAALALLKEAYRGAFAADLISGLPFQDEEALSRDIGTLLSYEPAHVSLYDLTVEKNTPLYRNARASKVSLPAPETAERLWIRGRDSLEAGGYPQYEVSNFAPEGSRSVHNTVYWRMGSWLGAGPSASGTIIADGGGGVRGLRRTVYAGIRRYLSAAAPSVRVETLDRETLIKESFLMGFRYIEGPDSALFKKRFGCPIESLAPKTLDAWRKRGKMREGLCALNRDGLLVLNAFLTDCFIELDGSTRS
jgi:oxygen-independent coproporphyrinogen-3 oxidase